MQLKTVSWMARLAWILGGGGGSPEKNAKETGAGGDEDGQVRCRHGRTCVLVLE